MATIVVYGGGFQPFHEGHLSSYLQAKKALGDATFYVAASNDVKQRPIPFKDKQFLAQQAGVVDPFIETKNPINPQEILAQYDPEQDVYIMVRSERDPVPYTKKDGSPAYYQPYVKGQPMAPFSKHGYVFVTKKHNFTVNGEEVYSGSQVRSMYGSADDAGRMKMIQQLYPKSKQQQMIKKLLDKYLASPQEPAVMKTKTTAMSKLKNKALAEQISRIRPLIKEASPQMKLKFMRLMKTAITESKVNELSPQTLASYKKKAGADATASDKAGNFKRGDKRMSGIMKATRKEFDNDSKNVTEAFDQPYKLKWEKSGKDITATTKLDDGGHLGIMFQKGYNQDKEEAWSVEFYRNNSQEVTGEGDAQRVFSTVLSSIQSFIKKYAPNKVMFAASKEADDGQNSQSRARLYDSLVQRYAKSWGFRAFRAETGNKVFYELSRRDPVKETLDDPWGDQGNFAGDKPVNIGGDIVKRLEVGDIVLYLGQKAKILAQSKPDGKYSRITIASDFGGTTKDVLTSDLKRLSKDMAETTSTAIADTANRLANKNDGKVAKLRVAGDQRREEQLKGRDIAKRDTTSKDQWGNVKESTGLSVEQLAHISDKALDDAYHYGRSTPGANFGWLANLQSAKAAKRLIDAGETDIEKISDAIHAGWNVTAAADYKGQLQLDTPTPDEKKLKRAKLAQQSYSQLPEEEKEKDRVVARAMLAALGKTNVSESVDYLEEK